MLSSRKTRFQWGKQDRSNDPSLFRSMAQHWHPTVRTHAADADDAVKVSSPILDPNTTGNEAPTWTPWLWVD
ncbi:MAG: hypothetical protein HXX10_02050 [Rhodoplanes sp.]|uniref:hypothetical protein n=1 Tax=Rhodoplanes sp. TaxID=1968906 RepID=UPI0017F3702A|nr:hypothetical protein [Rhodoplanes sp.]NVO12796.1 hypothetical protein [Rhodoplanes sp.]